ncbi:MAG TPA: TonB-dependent receptor, partial [Ruminiclostridium sp.]
FLLLLLCFHSIYAQNRETKKRYISIVGHIKDSFTKAGIPNTFVTITNEKGDVLDTTTAKLVGGFLKSDATYQFIVPADPQKYSIIARSKGYEECIVSLDIKRVARNTYFEVPYHYMKRKSAEQEITLGEIVVEATKVKMAYRGDTIIYNADAFNVPGGSMLDAVIKQLPGVELKENGEIFVEGRKIENLTLNGKDFFKGRNKVLLENLPYYTVKDINVYESSTEKSEWVGKDIEDKLLIMNVNLKREYNNGLLGNIEAGAGSSDRYLGRYFLSRFADHSRFATYANINNINETSQPGGKGEWASSNMPQREWKTTSFGASYMLNNKDGKWEERANANITISQVENKLSTILETFLTNNNNYYWGKNNQKNKMSNFFVFNQFILKVPFRLSTLLQVGYNKEKSNTAIYSGTFNEDPGISGLHIDDIENILGQTLNPNIDAIIVNKLNNRAKSDNGRLNTTLTLNSTHKLANGDNLDFTVEGNYQKTEDNKYETYDLNYYNPVEIQDFRNTYKDSPITNYYVKSESEYSIHWLNKWNLSTSYQYRFDHKDTDSKHYRLDEYESWHDMSSFGILPSISDSLLSCLDLFNSYKYKFSRHNNQIAFRPYFQKKYGKNELYTNITIPLSFQYDQLEYNSEQIDSGFSQKHFLFNPSMELKYNLNNQMSEYRFKYEFSQSTPNIVQRVGVIDNTQPLAIKIGNPNLKKNTAHKFLLSFASRKSEIQQSVSLQITANMYANAIGNGFIYNPKNGVYTYMPRNINGNWDCNTEFYWRRAIDNKERFLFNSNTMLTFMKSVDYANIIDQNLSELNKVNNTYIKEFIGVDYSNKNFSGTVSGSFIWRNAVSNCINVSDINVFEHSIGAQGIYKFPLGLKFSNEVRLYSRRGFSESSLNKNELVWNSSLSYSFHKDKYVVRINAFDILDQLSASEIAINAQGRKEIIRNVLPHYYMVHIQYNFFK